MAWTIRTATLADRGTLQDIERLAGEQFRDVGFGEVADHDPFSLDELAEYVGAERSWVAADDEDQPIGYVVVDVVDHNTHVEQVSVLPEYQGRGVGRALMDWVDGWATARDHEWVTLTTFTDVPWNAPLYRHRGFEVLAESEIGPDLLAVRAAETAHGLDPRPASACGSACIVDGPGLAARALRSTVHPLLSVPRNVPEPGNPYSRTCSAGDVTLGARMAQVAGVGGAPSRR